jgi:hypothetical protein
MVEAGRITLRVEIDAKQFEAIIKKLKLDMKDFKTQVDNTTPGIEKLGDTATTTAVRFQTLTQGTINLVTSFTQAYTSISNLQRAKTSLQAAAVGVERAIDLQRRKQFQLNEELAKAAPNYQKVELLTRELETAHDDLAVKQQRVKDQTDAVSDTYVLFALNIANVGFSAIQTGASMIKMAEGTRVAAAASKLLEASTRKWTFVALGLVAAYEILVQIIGQSNQEFKQHYSIIENINRLMGEWSRSTDITLDNYESKINSARDSTLSMGSAWSDMTGQIKSEINIQKNSADEWADYWSKATKKAIANMRIGMAQARDEAYSSVPGGTQGNFTQAQAGVRIPITAAQAIRGGNVAAYNYKQIQNIIGFLFPNVPEAQAELMLQNNSTKSNDTDYGIYSQNVANKIQEYRAITSTYGAPRIIRKLEPGLPGLFGRTYVSRVEQSLVQIPAHLQTQQPMALGAPSKLYDKITDIDEINYRINELQKAEAMLEKNISTFQNDPNMNTWLYLAGQTTLQLMELEEMKAEAEAPLTFKPFKPKPYKSESEFMREFKENFIERFPAGSRILQGGPGTSTFRSSYKKIREDEVNKFFDKFKTQYYLGAAYRGQIRQEGTMLMRDISPYGDFRFNFPSGSGAVFYGGTGGQALAYYQLNTQASFGSQSHVLKSLELNQLLAIQQQQKTKGGMPRPTNLRAFLGAYQGAQNYINDPIANPMQVSGGGMGLTQAQINAGATWEDVKGIQGGAYRFAQRNNAALMARRAEIAREDAWRNSVIGQNAQAAQALLTGGSFAYSRRVARAGGGLSQDMALTIRAAGLLGVSVPYEAFNTTASQIFSGAATGLSEIVKANNVRQDFLFAAMDAISLSLQPGIQALRNTGWSAIRNPGGAQAISKYMFNTTSERLQTYVSRVAQGNFGIYDATLLNAMTGAVVGELAHENEVFNSKISPVLGIAHNDFKSLLVDPKRGINEIDDRIRWTQRLEQISTGATVI